MSGFYDLVEQKFGRRMARVHRGVMRAAYWSVLCMGVMKCAEVWLEMVK